MARGVWQRNIVTNSGDVIAGAQIDVVNEATGLPVALYSDRTGGSNIGNPAFADSNGFIQFYTDPARVRVTASGVAGTQTFRNENIIDIEEIYTTDSYQPDYDLGVGAKILMKNKSGATIASAGSLAQGTIVSGSNINRVMLSSGGVFFEYGGITAGSWRLSQSRDVLNNEIGYFVRIV